MQRQKISFPFQSLDLLLEDLQQVFRFNLHLIADVGGTLEELQQDLISLKGLMLEISTDNYESEYIKRLAEEISGILGEGEIAIGTFVVESAAQKKPKGWISRAFHRVAGYPTDLQDLKKKIAFFAEDIKLINQENIKNSFEELRYNQARPIFTRKPPTKLSGIFKCDDQDEHVFGFDNPIHEVVDLLISGPENLEVVSIAGMSGLGKTTLARMVYKDHNVDYEFMIRAFVCVSGEYDKRDVLLQILSCVAQISDTERKMDDVELEKYLYSQLEGKQYLVVLDDVSDVKDWHRFKGAFPDTNKKSRVLITTTNTKVAECANLNNTNSLYRLELLNEEDSRKLLRHNVYGDDHCPSELEEYETEIVSKCDGLPLAVVLIARILRNDFDKVDWWKEVAKNVIDVANSVRDDVRRDTMYTTRLVEMMYRHLPNYLKPCFLYLGIFPEGWEIPVWKLVRLWISEGVIEHFETVEWEDTAEWYLEELVSRNLVVLGQRKKNGRIKTCSLKRIIREFCKREAVKENLFEEIKKDRINFYMYGSPGLDQHRRLCINSEIILDYLSGFPWGRSVRSFSTFSKEEVSVESELAACIPRSFKLLRVLEIESLLLFPLPVEIVNLLLLKYLAISSHISSIPSAISALQNLQTLIVSTTSLTLEIKADIWNMSQFRHLHTNAVATLPIPDAKKSKEDSFSNDNIQTLCMIAPKSCRGELLERTPNLKKLVVNGDLTKIFQEIGEFSFYQNLHTSKYLKNLKLLNDKAGSQPCLSCEYLPENLSKLTLMNTRLEWTEMLKLGQLENLQILKLKDFAFQGPSWNTTKDGFRRLEHLHIGETDLIEWEVSVDAFPSLKSLELNGCDKLNTFPYGFGDTPSLQSVNLYCTNKTVASCARRFQALKIEKAKRDNERNTFKLSVYPPESPEH